MYNDDLSVILLLDNTSKLKYNFSLPELITRDVKIIQSLDGITNELVEQGYLTLILLEDYPVKYGNISDLKLYKEAFSLNVKYITSKPLYSILMSDCAECYEILPEDLDLKLLIGIITGDTATISNYSINPDKVVDTLDELKYNLEKDNMLTDKVYDLYDLSKQLYDFAYCKQEEVKILKKYITNLEQTTASNSTLVDKVYSELVRLMKDESKRSKSLEQYECILSEDFNKSISVSQYPNRPVVVYIKQYTKIVNLDEFLFTLYDSCRRHYSLNCKIVKLFDSSNSIETMLQPVYYKKLRNSYKTSDIDTNDFLCKFGDYSTLMNHLLENKINFDILFIVDIRPHDFHILAGSDLNFTTLQNINECNLLQKDKVLAITNTPNQTLTWNPNKDLISDLDDIDNLYKLSTEPAIDVILKNINIVKEDEYE